MRHRGLAVLVGFVLLVVLAGAAAADSPSKQRIDELFWAVSAFAVAVFAVVLGILLWFLWRYRESVSPERDDHLEHHVGLEIAWTIVPIVILLLILAMSWPVLQFTDTQPPADTTILAVSERFTWTFRYEDGSETINELWVRQNAVVRFEATSKDVIHSFAIPALAIRIDAIPGRVNAFWTQPLETGDYLVECVELCGVGHYNMRAVLHVFPESESRM